MEAWVLFFWFGSILDSEVKTAEFASEISCEAAGERLRQERKSWDYFCVKK